MKNNYLIISENTNTNIEINNFKLLMIVLLFVSSLGNAQCTITGNPIKAQNLSCTSFSTCNTIYIGDGINTTVINMDADLIFGGTGCFQGPILFIIRNNASLDFSKNNFNLQLPEGSGIIVEPGGNLTANSNCSASDLIKIGNVNVATCNGGAQALYSFPEIVSNGGFNYLKATASPNSICGQGTSIINADMTLVPDNSEITFRWYDVPSGGSPLQTSTDNTAPYSNSYTTNILSATKKYYVEVTITNIALNLYLTTSRTHVEITVNPNPTIPTISVSGPTTFCAGGSVTLTSSSGTSYLWSNGATSPIITVNTSGNYSLQVTNANGCQSASSTAISVTANPLPTTPTISASGPSTFCAGGNVTLTSSNGTSYLWSNGATNPSIAVSTSGNYSVQVTDANGCQSASSTATIVTVNPLPTTPTISMSGPTTFCAGGSVTLTSSTGTSYLWSNGATNPSIAVSTSGNYSVQVTNANGCQSASSTATLVTANPLPAISLQPNNQLDCEGNSVRFKAVASGTGLIYTWQRKKPSESSFTTIPSETNITYPSAGEIKIDNVGSTQSPSTTQYLVVITDSNGCNITSNVATLTVNEITNVTGGTNITQCYGTNYSYTVTTSIPTNVVSYKWKKSITSGLWTDITDDGTYSGSKTATLTITGGTPSESAEYRVYVTFVNSTTNCNVDSSTRTRKITFLPQLTTPTLSITQPNCKTPTGSVLFSDLPSGIWTINQSGGAANSYSSNTSNYTITNVTPGNYNFTVTDSNNSCISNSMSITIISSITRIWNGTVWVNGYPTTNDAVTFTGDYSSTGNLETCSCQVNSGNVVFNSGNTFTVANEIEVLGGSLTFQNNASLIQTSNVAINSGNIKVIRNSAPLVLFDYTYWCAPTSGTQTLYNFSPNSNPKNFLSYNNGWNNLNPSTTTFSKGIGYAIICPKKAPSTPTTFTYQFIGTPNNGIMQIPNMISGTDYSRLIGNPYPSALDADEFINNNPSITGTLYFWTHNHPVNSDGSYNQTDYAYYNLTGSAGVSETGYSKAPNKWISSGQGFLVRVKASGSLTNITFNNDMRIGAIASNNTNFYRSSTSIYTKPELKKNRIWLDLSFNSVKLCQTLIGYIENATNEYDSGFDGAYIGSNKISLYSLIGDQEYTIQGRAIPFSKNDIVPLGFKTDTSGNFNISLNQFDGLFNSYQDIYIEDKLLNTSHNLKISPYIFSTTAGTFNDRFIIKYTDNIISLNNISKSANTLSFITSNDRSFIIKSDNLLIQEIDLYSITGQLIYHKENINELQTLILNLTDHQTYIAKVKLTDGSIENRKIFL